MANSTIQQELHVIESTLSVIAQDLRRLAEFGFSSTPQRPWHADTMRTQLREIAERVDVVAARTSVRGTR